MRNLIMLFLLVPLVSAGTFSESISLLTNDNASLVLNISGNIILPTEESEQKEVGELKEDSCINMSITGLPLISDDGVKLSYGFEPWMEGDEVTYWVEDARGGELKKPYATTSPSKKSYTPSFDVPEKAIILKAERKRIGCPLSEASAAVIILGEELSEDACLPEVMNCSCESGITSLYVRAKNWQENITLYGNAEDGGVYWLFGEDSPRYLLLGQGPFSIPINPAKGNNTYGIAPASSVRTAAFSLAFEEPDKEESQEQGWNGSSVVTNGNLSGSYSFPATGQVILDDGTQTNTTVLVAAVTVIGGLLLASRLKTKNLIIALFSRKSHAHQQQAHQEGDQRKNRRRLVAG